MADSDRKPSRVAGRVRSGAAVETREQRDKKDFAVAQQRILIDYHPLTKRQQQLVNRGLAIAVRHQVPGPNFFNADPNKLKQKNVPVVLSFMSSKDLKQLPELQRLLPGNQGTAFTLAGYDKRTRQGAITTVFIYDRMLPKKTLKGKKNDDPTFLVQATAAAMHEYGYNVPSYANRILKGKNVSAGSSDVSSSVRKAQEQGAFKTSIANLERFTRSPEFTTFTPREQQAFLAQLAEDRKRLRSWG